MRASAEGPPDKSVKAVCDDFRGWLRSVFVSIARAGGAADPEQLGRQLHLLYDGATIAAQMDHDDTAAVSARDSALALFDAAVRRR